MTTQKEVIQDPLVLREKGLAAFRALTQRLASPELSAVQRNLLEPRVERLRTALEKTAQLFDSVEGTTSGSSQEVLPLPPSSIVVSLEKPSFSNIDTEPPTQVTKFRSPKQPATLEEINTWYDQQMALRGGNPDILLSGYDQIAWDLLRSFKNFIIFEDEDILIVNKPPRINSHFGQTNIVGVEEIAKYHRGPFVRVVQAMDRNSSGALILGKNKKAGLGFNDQFAKYESPMRKIYLAILDGELEAEDSLRVNVPVASTRSDRMRIAEDGGGKDSLTTFRPIAVFANERGELVTLTEIEPITYVPHQIRVVSADYLNHPLVGDNIYNPNYTGAPRTMLHAFELTFQHPITNEIFTVHSPLPYDFTQMIRFSELVYFQGSKK